MSTTLKQMDIDGTVVWVEMDEVAATAPATLTARSGPAPGVGFTSAQPGTDGSLSRLAKADVAGTLRALVKPVQEALSTLGPEEITLELSLGLKGEVGVFVAKSEGNAAIKITAKWKPAKPAAQP